MELAPQFGLENLFDQNLMVASSVLSWKKRERARPLNAQIGTWINSQHIQVRIHCLSSLSMSTSLMKAMEFHNEADEIQ